jgi:hypothetical protein
MAMGARPVEFGRVKYSMAIAAAHSNWDVLKGELGTLGDGILAQDIKVKADAIGDDAAHLAQDDVDSANPLYLKVYSPFQG